MPEEYRQQVRVWIDTSLHREPGQMETSEAGIQAFMETAGFYYNLVQQRRADPQDDMISKLIAAQVPDGDGTMRQLDDIEICGFATLLGGAGAETVTKLLGTAVVNFARFPEQWQKLLDDRSKIPAAVEELLRYEGPVQYQVRYTLKEATLHGVTIPAGKPVFLIAAAANRDPRAFTDALARMESAIALERLLDFMPRYEVQWDRLERVHMQNVAGWHTVPVKVLR